MSLYLPGLLFYSLFVIDGQPHGDILFPARFDPTYKEPIGLLFQLWNGKEPPVNPPTVEATDAFFDELDDIALVATTCMGVVLIILYISNLRTLIEPSLPWHVIADSELFTMFTPAIVEKNHSTYNTREIVNHLCTSIRI